MFQRVRTACGEKSTHKRPMPFHYKIVEQYATIWSMKRTV